MIRLLDRSAKRIAVIIHTNRFLAIRLPFPCDSLTGVWYIETMDSQPRAKPPLKYFAGLLRLWQVRSEGRTAWRASLEDPHTHERRTFVGLDSLFAFLKEQTEEDKET